MRFIEINENNLLSTPSIVIVGLLNILVIGLFFVFIFKRKVTLTTHTEKVVFNSNLILMLISLHYLSGLVLYICECIFNNLPFLPAFLIPDLSALFFWALLIFVVKKLLLRRAQSKISIPSAVIAKKSPSNLKVTVLALLPVIATAMYFAYPSIAPKFSSNLLIKITCDDYHLVDEYSVNVERNEVVQIRKGYDEKNVPIFSDITKLNDCVIVNSKNWTCGGKFNYGGTDAKTKSIDGIYSYIPRSTAEPNSCKTEQLN